MNKIADKHFKEILRGALLAFMLKLVAVAVTFGLNVVLARLLGAKDSGIFFLAFTVLTIAATIGRLGMDNSLVRFIAANMAVERHDKVKGVYVKAMLIAGVASTIVAIMLWFSSQWMADNLFRDDDLGAALQGMSIAIIPTALFMLHAQALQGLKRLGMAIPVLSIWTPLLTIVLSWLLVPVFGVNAAICSYLVASIVTLVIAFFVWHAATPFLKGKRGVFDMGELFESSIPLFWVALMNQTMMWSANFMLGIYHTTREVGIFNAANRTAMLTSFVLIAVNAIAAPKFAALYKQGDMQALRDIAWKTTLLGTSLACVPFLVFALAPGFVLGVFGADFLVASDALIILAVGQFVNVITGPVGYLLIMSGKESVFRDVLIIALLFNFSLCFVLIPAYAVDGAAIATAASVVVQNVFAAVMVKRVLGINILTGWRKTNRVVRDR